jgi:transposase
MSPITWKPKQQQAAILLAQGYTINEAAAAVKVSEKTIDRWKRDIAFTQEIDRLSLMIGIASRAERLRIAQRIARERTKDDTVISKRDLLDWLQFAQSETDGVKLDLATLRAALSSDDSPLAGRRPGGDNGESGETEQ